MAKAIRRGKFGPAPAAADPERRRRYNDARNGAIAQLGERYVRIVEVGGSSPPGSIFRRSGIS